LKSNRDFNRNALIIILIAIFLSWLVAFIDRDKQYVPEPSSIPPPPDSSGEWHYNYQENTWQPIYRGHPRANGENGSREPYYMNEDDLQEYLEEHVDGYLEDTYWGEEYDLKDPDDN